VEARADIAGSPREDQAPPVGGTKRDGVATTPTTPSIVAAEQYLCFLLGLICMACGGWGVCMKYSLDLSSGYISWLGSAYGPTLRLTAVHASFWGGASSFRVCKARPVIGLRRPQSFATCRKEPRAQCKENTWSRDEFRLRAKVKRKELT
jgi:hypothetical protein